MANNPEMSRDLNLARMTEIAAQPDHDWRVYLASLEYIKAGWFVVPITPNSKKLPRADTNVNYGSSSRRRKIMEKWFHPDKGSFRGYNIGIATGREGGAFVMDVDRHGDVDGMATLKTLEAENGAVPDCPVAMTPNDGRHYFFKWQENASQSSGKIGKGIDTRGGDADACRGHVVAFPSTINGKMYMWEKMTAAPEIPVWIMEKMGVLWKPKPQNAMGLGNEHITDADLEQPISEAQIVSMLDAIDPNELGYDDWLKMGLSVKSQLPNEVGLAIWDEWSQKGKRYKPGECDIRWNGFSDFGTVRGGTLFYYAKQAGWKPDATKGERGGNPFDELVTRMNQEYAVVSVGGELRILREKGKIVNEWEAPYDLLKRQTFEGLLLNDIIWAGDEDPKPIPVTKIWLGHEARRTYENGLGLFPLQSAPEGYYNTWHGFSVEPKKGECGLFLNHLEEVICDGDAKQYTWLLTWLADLVQDPANPKGCAIVMRGGEGCGKGTFANAIGSLLGPHHRHLIDDTHLTSNFNSHLFDAITIFADEITWGGNKKTAGKLKGMVTEKYLIGERKGVDAIQYRNCCHLIVASNSEWVIPASYDSRRWFVLDVPSTKVGDFQYFGAIADELENGGMEALLHYLQHVPLTAKEKGTIRSAPVTEGLKKQRVLNTAPDDHLRWWTKILESGEFPIMDAQAKGSGWPQVASKQDLYAHYEKYCMDRNRFVTLLSPWSTRMMQEFGFKTTKIRKDGGRVNAYKVPSRPECINKIEEKYSGLLDVGLEEESEEG